MFYVLLKKPLPGVPSTVFVFYNVNEAYEFSSCVHAKFEDAETEVGEVGVTTEVFESWSF